MPAPCCTALCASTAMASNLQAHSTDDTQQAAMGQNSQSGPAQAPTQRLHAQAVSLPHLMWHTPACHSAVPAAPPSLPPPDVVVHASIPLRRARRQCHAIAREVQVLQPQLPQLLPARKAGLHQGQGGPLPACRPHGGIMGADGRLVGARGAAPPQQMGRAPLLEGAGTCQRATRRVNLWG